MVNFSLKLPDDDITRTLFCVWIVKTPYSKKKICKRTYLNSIYTIFFRIKRQSKNDIVDLKKNEVQFKISGERVLQ